MAAFDISSSYTKKSAAAAAAGGGGDGDGGGRTGRAERLEKRQDGVRASVGSSGGDKRLKQTTMTPSGDIKLVILLNLVVSVLISLLKLLISVKN
jgi:hypothetical protein